MSSKTLTITLLVLITLMALWTSGKLQQIFGAVFL